MVSIIGTSFALKLKNQIDFIEIGIIVCNIGVTHILSEEDQKPKQARILQFYNLYFDIILDLYLYLIVHSRYYYVLCTI